MKPHLEFYGLSIRARAALVLQMARDLLPVVQKDRAYFRLAKRALVQSERWAAGERVRGAAIARDLCTDVDQGLIFAEQLAPPGKRQRDSSSWRCSNSRCFMLREHRSAHANSIR